PVVRLVRGVAGLFRIGFSMATPGTPRLWARHKGTSGISGGEMAQWLTREFTDRKVRGSNLTSASRLPLCRLGQPGSIQALVLHSGGMAARHRKGATAERLLFIISVIS
ncbi:hypothetical protein CSKR_101782, partial [Clonorchis sinensis]